MTTLDEGSLFASSRPHTPHKQFTVIYGNKCVAVVNKPADVRMDASESSSPTTHTGSAASECATSSSRGEKEYELTVERWAYRYMESLSLGSHTQEKQHSYSSSSSSSGNGCSCSAVVSIPRRALKFVHQLDYATSGVLCLAFDKTMSAALAHCFQMRTTVKYYLAVLLGHVPEYDNEHTSCVHCNTEDEANSLDTQSIASRVNFSRNTNNNNNEAGNSDSSAVCRNCERDITSSFGYWLQRHPYRGVDGGATGSRSSSGIRLVDESIWFADEVLLHAMRHCVDEAEAASSTVCGSKQESDKKNSNSKECVFGLAQSSLTCPVRACYTHIRAAAMSYKRCVEINLPIGYATSNRSSVATEDDGKGVLESARAGRQHHMCVHMPVHPVQLSSQSSSPDTCVVGSCSSASPVPDARDSLTHLTVLKRTYMSHPVTRQSVAVTHVLLRPRTGRRHQLRVHCHALGFPILGDVTYAGVPCWPSNCRSINRDGGGNNSTKDMYDSDDDTAGRDSALIGNVRSNRVGEDVHAECAQRLSAAKGWPRMYLHAWLLRLPCAVVSAETVDARQKLEERKRRRRETHGRESAWVNAHANGVTWSTFLTPNPFCCDFMWTDRYTPRCVADSAWSREKRQGLTQIVRGLCDGSESPHITLLHGPTGCGKLTTLRALLQQELAQANPSHTPHSATAVAETTRATKTAAHGGAAPSQIDCRVEYVDPSSSTQNSCVSHNHVSESDNDLITVVHTCDITLASYKQVLQNTLLLCSGAAATHSQLQLHASQRSDDASWTPTASLSLSSMQTQSNGRPDAAVQANAIAKATDQARVRALVIKFYGELASDSVQACTRDFVMEYESYTHSAAAAAGAHLVAHHDETTCRDVGSRRNSQETDKDRVAWRRAERNTSSSRDCAHTPTRALHRYLIFFIHTTHDTHSSRVHLRSCFGAHVVTSPAVKLFACTPVTALNLRRRLLTILHAESVQRQQQQQQQQDERHSHGSGDGLYQDSWSSQAQTVIQRSNSCSSSGNSSSNDVVELHTSRSFSATAATAAAVSTAAVSQCGQQSGTSRGRDGGAPHTHRCVGVAVDGKKNTKVCHSTSGTCKVEDDFTSMMLRHKRRRAQAPQQHDAMSGGKNWGQRGVTVGIAPLSSRPLPLLTPDALDTIVNTSQGDVRQAILQAQWTALIPPGVPPLAAPTAAMARSRSGERAHERRNDAASCSVLSCSPPDTRSHRRRHRSVSAPASSSTPTVLDILTDMAEESDVAAMTAGSGTQWVKTSHNMGCESCGDVARQNDSMVHRSRATTSTTKKNNSSTMNHYRVDRTFRNMIDNSYPNHHVDDTNDANNSHEDHTKDDASSDATCDLSHGRAAQSVAAVRDEYLDLSHATARLLCQRYTLGSVLATLNVAPHRLLDYLVNNLPYYFHENQVTGYALCVRAASMADTRRVSDYALLPSSNNSSADRSISRGIGESNLSYGDVPGTVGWCDGHLPHGVGCAARPPAYHPLPSAGGGLSLDVMALHLFDASYRCFHPRHAHRLARGFMPQRPPPYTPDAYPRGRGFGRDAMHVVEGTSCSSSSSSWYTGAGRPAGDACDDSSDGGGGSVCRSTVEWERVWMRRLGVRGGKEAYGRGEGGGIDAATRGGGAGRARGMREQGMSDNGEQVHKEEEKAMRSWPGGSGWGVLQRRCVGGDRRRVWANRATYGMWSANGHAGEEEEEAVSSALVKAARSASPGLVHGNVWTNRHGGVIWTNEEDKGEHALGEKSAGVKCSGRCAQSVSASVSPGIRSSEYDMLREGLPSVMERCGAREAVLDYFWFAQRIVLECEADEDGGGGGGGAAVDGPEESTRGEEMGRGRAPLVQRRTVFSLAGAGKSNSSSSTTALTSRTDTRTRPVEERVDRSWSGHVPPGCGPPRRTTFVLRRSPTPMPPTQSAHSASLPTRRAVTALQYAILRCGLPASVSLRRDRFVVVGMDDGEEEGGGGDGWNDGWQGRATPAAVVEDLSCRPLMPPGEDIEEFSD